MHSGVGRGVTSGLTDENDIFFLTVHQSVLTNNKLLNFMVFLVFYSKSKTACLKDLISINIKCQTYFVELSDLSVMASVFLKVRLTFKLFFK